MSGFICHGFCGQRPNIIYIMSDDHAYQAISAYGGILKDYAPTPNIDRIARDGMRFDRCLVKIHIRSWQGSNSYRQIQPPERIYCNEGQKPFDGSQQTFQNCYGKRIQTAMIGKWHLGSDPTGFDHWRSSRTGSYYNPNSLQGMDVIRIKGMLQS